jgi:CHAD domain-containing protein
MSPEAKRSRAIFRKLEQDIVKLSSKPQAQNVHRFRTGTRRLQILLGEISPHLDRKQKKLLKLLGRIRKRAGKMRDLDVQLTALRSLKVAREARRKTQLINHLIELRRKQEKKLCRAVEPGTVREIRKRLQHARREFSTQSSRDPLTVARNILKRIDATAPITEPLLHRYRILGKRARYAAEFAGHSAEAQRFIAQLKRIQDALGDWHDWLTLTQTASQYLDDVPDSALIAELRNVTGAKFRYAVTVLTQVRTALEAQKAPTPPPAKPTDTKTMHAVSAA